MYKKYYQNFLQANTGVQHYAAHSHHYWPDVTREAMLRYWDDSAQYVDDKWDYFFSKKVPNTQKLIAQVLNLSQPQQIVFAPNTHEFVLRLISCLDLKKEIKILTTDSEFYSFDRQALRLEELGNIKIDRVPTQDFASFEDRLIQKIKSEKYDLIFFSQVFFNSGFVVNDLEKIVRSIAHSETIIAIDGYHAFMAVPTDLSAIQNRIFYIAGSYKYAQGGEGCCFMHVPPQTTLRPLYTGWFAGFSELSHKKSQLSYSDDGYRFAGSTMDFSALYRLEAVLSLFQQENITVQKIHAHIQMQQNNFLNHIEKINHPVLNQKNILGLDFSKHAHFFAFEINNTDTTASLYQELKRRKIITDYRSTRLRFGFGLYQEDCINLNYG